MRPTFLQFRSPKEQTGEFLYVDVTSIGKSLRFKPKEYLKSSFPKSQRWEHIRQVACRTSFKVGPGCYNTPMTTNKGKGVRIVKEAALESTSPQQQWDYMYVGDVLVKKERPSSRASFNGVSFSLTDKNLSPYNSSRNVVGESHRRPHSVVRERTSFGDFLPGRESPSPTAKRTYVPHHYNTSPSPSKKRAASSDFRDSPYAYGKRIYPTNDFKGKPLNSQHSPSYKLRSSGNVSPGKNTLKSSRSLKGEEAFNVKEKDFYAALQDQWGAAKKIVIHNDRPDSRLKGRGQATRL